MGYIIIDLEFNNLKNITNYQKDFFEKYGEFDSVSLENEIIEIGAVKVDKYMKPIKEIREYIKPKIFPVINPIVTEITKIDMDILNEKGVSFEDAISKLKDMFEDGDVLCSWAKDDVAELIINAHHYNYNDLRWLNEYLDIQEYVTKILAHKKALGLKSALDELKIKVDDTKLHDALNDAKYTVEVFRRVYNSRVVKNYIVKDIYNMPAMQVSDLESIEIEEEKLMLKCPKCGKKIDLQTPIKLLNWRFAAVGTCPKCKSNVLCEVLVKKTLQGENGYNEVNSILKDEAYLNYIYKLENSEKKR
ncbi:3'-5' exonuclease [Clostridium beijerinckii]|uniref:Inhibitor of KinA sporulation pathway (Predicted exonuclease) n=1 Tax=Clostridium beijerinckii TaxID=1520 RepID=A0AAX0B4C1_CLOBE|nr:3'-5' exonuclease [Clostridium beijerinckii]NRT89871.1 inhibitor of KinA sporulation pathway (predicted exonuclease) [Clostridium beijerinckii]NYC75328.1 inhibitor of KinA sporulation pathway (predicted exonuclease) [Clostridium beijerinckii]